MKTNVRMRPFYHHKDERIRAHIVLSWLAMLLLRVDENRTYDTWRTLRSEPQLLHLVTLVTDHVRVAQLSLLTSRQEPILESLGDGRATSLLRLPAPGRLSRIPFKPGACSHRPAPHNRKWISLFQLPFWHIAQLELRNSCFSANNEHPKPFVWVNNADGILARIASLCTRPLEARR